MNQSTIATKSILENKSPSRVLPATCFELIRQTPDQTRLPRHSDYEIEKIRDIAQVLIGLHFVGRTADEKNLAKWQRILSLRYLCGLNCACAWRRPSAAALNSGLSCSAASNSGMLSLGFPDSRRAHPRLAWAAVAFWGSSRTDS